MMRPILLLLLCLLGGTGCSADESVGDGVRLVHRHDQPIDEAMAPPGFVVTPQEVLTTLPIEKWGHSLYADEEFYYLSDTMQKFTSKTGDNSALAKRNGVRVSGINRKDIEARLAERQRQDSIEPTVKPDRCSMGFADLFRLAKGRDWTEEEVRGFQALDQPGKNKVVKQLAAEAGCIRTEDQVGTDGVVYTAFWKEAVDHH